MNEYSPVTVDGQRAVVIGGTSGIGKSISLGFAADGADVVASSRGDATVAETAAQLRDRGAETIEQPCDVTDADTLETLRDAVVSSLGGVDTLVISAGAIGRQRVTDVTDEEWGRVLDVQLDGVRRAIATFEPMIDGGSIVTISSMTAQVGMPEVAAYTAAKGGVEALTRAAAKELGPTVRVNAIAPGFFHHLPEPGHLRGRNRAPNADRGARGDGSSRRNRGTDRRGYLPRLGCRSIHDGRSTHGGRRLPGQRVLIDGDVRWNEFDLTGRDEEVTDHGISHDPINYLYPTSLGLPTSLVERGVCW